MNKTLLALAALTLGVTAQAQIIGVTGSAAVLGVPPANVSPNAFEDDVNTWVFHETNQTLSADLEVDADAPGTYTAAGTATILAGTAITSYYLTSDQVGVAGSQNYHGTVTFQQRILGVIGRNDRLDISDPILGFGGTTYGTGIADRQWEYNQNEQYTLSADMKTIRFSDQLTTSADQLRIVTEAVPEPTTIAILTAGAAALAARRRKK